LIRLVFDTSALLAFFKGEGEAPQVRLLLEGCEEGRSEGIISTLTMSEIYYILARIAVRRAEDRFDLLEKSVLVKYDVDPEVARGAGRLKAKHGGVSIVDCIVAATALVSGAQCVVASERDIEHFYELGEVEVRTPREGVKLFS